MRKGTTAIMALAVTLAGAAILWSQPPPEDGPRIAASGRASAAHATNGGDNGPLPVTLEQARLAALESNARLEIARHGPRLAATFVSEEWSLFDPHLVGDAGFRTSTQQLSAVQRFTYRPDEGGDGGDQPSRPLFLDIDAASLSLGLEKLFASGAALSLSGTLDRTETNFTPAEFSGAWTLEIAQPLLEGRGREVNLVTVHQAENALRQSDWELRAAVRDIVAAVERVYWELVLAQEVVRIQSFGVRLAEEQLELNRDLADTGRAVRSAVLAAEAEAAARRAELAGARGQVRAVSVELARLMRRPDVEPGVVLEASDRPRVELPRHEAAAAVARALERRPEIHAQRLEIASADLQVAAARNGLRPTLDLVASYGRSSLGLDLAGGLEHLIDDSRYDTVSVGLRLDWPVRGRGEEARYERARLATSQAEASLADIELAVEEDVRLALIEVETQWLRVQASDDAVTARQAEFEVEQDRYRVGMARNLDVLETQRLLVQARVDAMTARIRYVQALVELRSAEGTLLDERGIEVEGK